MIKPCCKERDDSQIIDMSTIDGKLYLWKEDDDYGSDIKEEVKYCPFCGKKVLYR